MGDTFVRVVVRDVGDAAGIPGLHPHVLRHTFATRLVERGADLPTVQAAMGHVDPKTTSIYLRIRPARVKEGVARLDFDGADREEAV